MEKDAKISAENYKNKQKKRSEESKNRIITDPFGSWTGISTDDVLEMPIQDVDDL